MTARRRRSLEGGGSQARVGHSEGVSALSRSAWYLGRGTSVRLYLRRNRVFLRKRLSLSRRAFCFAASPFQTGAVALPSNKGGKALTTPRLEAMWLATKRS